MNQFAGNIENVNKALVINTTSNLQALGTSVEFRFNELLREPENSSLYREFVKLNDNVFWVLSQFTPKNLQWACLGYLQLLCTFNSKKTNQNSKNTIGWSLKMKILIFLWLAGITSLLVGA